VIVASLVPGYLFRHVREGSRRASTRIRSYDGAIVKRYEPEVIEIGAAGMRDAQEGRLRIRIDASNSSALMFTAANTSEG
jgi:hypothetical protein